MGTDLIINTTPNGDGLWPPKSHCDVCAVAFTNTKEWKYGNGGTVVHVDESVCMDNIQQHRDQRQPEE